MNTLLTYFSLNLSHWMHHSHRSYVTRASKTRNNLPYVFCLWWVHFSIICYSNYTSEIEAQWETRLRLNWKDTERLYQEILEITSLFKFHVTKCPIASKGKLNELGVFCGTRCDVYNLYMWCWIWEKTTRALCDVYIKILFNSFREGTKQITYYFVQLDSTINSLRTITIEVWSIIMCIFIKKSQKYPM